MKSYTSLEQAKKLAEFLPIESADMYYCYGMDIHTKGWSFDDTPTIIDNSNRIDVHADIPCWSLATLFSMLPKSAYLEKGSSTELCRVTLPVELISSDWNLEPVDACVAMIEKLHEQKLL